jgi:hypothetical protein
MLASITGARTCLVIRFVVRFWLSWLGLCCLFGRTPDKAAICAVLSGTGPSAPISASAFSCLLLTMHRWLAFLLVREAACGAIAVNVPYGGS